MMDEMKSNRPEQQFDESQLAEIMISDEFDEAQAIVDQITGNNLKINQVAINLNNMKRMVHTPKEGT